MTLRGSRRPRLSRLRALRRQLRRPRSGQTLVVFALVSLVIIGALGLVLDSGYNYAQRRHMQNVADAAALAGASALSGNNSGGYTVWSTVKSVVQQNGLQVSQIASCTYRDHNLDLATDPDVPPSCNDSPLPGGVDVTAVQVTVQESHQTFVMRALGIVTSGSSATATAQVQLVTQINNQQVPFIPCGVDTKLVDASGNLIKENGNPVTLSILRTSGQTLTYLPGNADQPTYGATDQFTDPTDPLNTSPTTRGVVEVNPAAVSYSYPTNMPGAGTPSPNPYAFYIHGPSGNDANGVTRCTASGASSFKGFNNQDLPFTIDLTKTLHLRGSYTYTTQSGYLPAVSPDSNSYNPEYDTGQGDLMYAGQGNRSGPASAIPGAGGCKPGQETNCILLLPVTDNSVGSGNGNSAVLAARVLLAFYMMGNSNSHWGYLVYPYNVTSPGTPDWRPGSIGVTTIHLVK